MHMIGYGSKSAVTPRGRSVCFTLRTRYSQQFRTPALKKRGDSTLHSCASNDHPCANHLQ